MVVLVRLPPVSPYLGQEDDTILDPSNVMGDHSKAFCRVGFSTIQGPRPFSDFLATVVDSPIPAHVQPDIGHINQHVVDLAEVVKSFHEFFGFEVIAHIGRNTTFLAAVGYHHHVAVNNWVGKTPAPHNATDLISYRFQVPNAQAMVIFPG